MGRDGEGGERRDGRREIKGMNYIAIISRTNVIPLGAPNDATGFSYTHPCHPLLFHT